MSMVLLGAGCADMTAKLPAGTVDPSFYTSAASVTQMAKNVRFEFQLAWREFAIWGGVFSDELRPAIGYGTGISGQGFWFLDARDIPDVSGFGSVDVTRELYARLQRTRSLAVLARLALDRYALDSARFWRSELLIYEGLTMVMLADLFCSGVPLSTVDLDGDWTYRPGSTTAEVYETALTRFDSAVVVSADLPASSQATLMSLARTSRGRVLLALGRIADAEAAIVSVPADWVYELPAWGDQTNGSFPWNVGANLSVEDGVLDGGPGMPFVTAGDPRISVTRTGSSYGVPRPTRHRISSGVETLLIRAEAAAARSSEELLEILNALRTSGAYTIDPTTGDTVYEAGSGGVQGLRPLTELDLESSTPNADITAARVNLLMRERAFWLFLSGHRQGDLRRLVRNYGREFSSVYKTGGYPGSAKPYGRSLDVPLPESERANPLAKGCLIRGA